MRKLTVLMLASSLALSASLANAADTTTAPAAPAAQTEGAQPSKAPMNHHMKRGPHDKRSPEHDMMFKGVDLTKEQRDQMREIAKEFRQAHKPGERMGQKFNDMHKLIAADSFDESAARAQIEASSKARNDMMLEHLKMQNKMYNVLTPEQKKTFNQKYEQRMQQWQERMNNPEKKAAQ